MPFSLRSEQLLPLQPPPPPCPCSWDLLLAGGPCTPCPPVPVVTGDCPSPARGMSPSLLGWPFSDPFARFWVCSVQEDPGLVCRAPYLKVWLSFPSATQTHPLSLPTQPGPAPIRVHGWSAGGWVEVGCLEGAAAAHTCSKGACGRLACPAPLCGALPRPAQRQKESGGLHPQCQGLLPAGMGMGTREGVGLGGERGQGRPGDIL